MIKLTHLGGEMFILNADLICYVESRPDTFITLTTGERLVVSESMDEVLRRAVAYQQAKNILPPRPRRPALDQPIHRTLTTHSPTPRAPSGHLPARPRPGQPPLRGSLRPRNQRRDSPSPSLAPIGQKRLFRRPKAYSLLDFRPIIPPPFQPWAMLGPGTDY